MDRCQNLDSNFFDCKLDQVSLSDMPCGFMRPAILRFAMKWSCIKIGMNHFGELHHQIIEPRNEISNNVVCATSKASD